MDHSFALFQNKIVVLDVISQYVYVGKLVDVDSHFVTLVDADVHDLRDANSPRELYVLEARKHGVNVNRQRVHVRLEQIISISELSDIHI